MLGKAVLGGRRCKAFAAVRREAGCPDPKRFVWNGQCVFSPPIPKERLIANASMRYRGPIKLIDGIVVLGNGLVFLTSWKYVDDLVCSAEFVGDGAPEIVGQSPKLQNNKC